MTELSALLAVGANYEPEPFQLSGNTQALLFFALALAAEYKNWRSFPSDWPDENERAEIDDLIEIATYEVMNAVKIHEIGEIMIWPVNTPPEKWLLANGQDVSRTTYAELFALIGTTYGPGNGTTTFAVPDFSDRSPMGTGTIVANPANVAGEQSHVLTTAEMPSHQHATSQTAHNHGQQVGSQLAYYGTGGTGRSAYGAVTTANTTRVVTDDATVSMTILPAGGGNAHNNVHPVLGVRFIIYAGV